MSKADRENYESQVVEERRKKKMKEVQDLKSKERYEQDLFFKKMHPMKTKEEKEGKDWVQL